MRMGIACFKCTVAASMLLVSYGTFAQDKPANYPQRPIRLVVTVAAGGGGDTIARAAGQFMSERWGQTVVVDNRAGGSGVIGSETVANSAPDGYTLLSYADAILLLGVTKRVASAPLKTFEPVVTMTSQPYVLVIQPNLPINNLKEF